MKHYVVVIDWANEFDRGVDILGVTHTIEEAKEIFNRNVDAERQIAERNGYTVDHDEELLFEAGEMGYWNSEHIILYVEEAN